jgi:hypothetical protein
VLRLVLTVVTFVLTAFSKLLTVLRFVLTVVTFVLTEFSKLLTVVTLLLTVKTAPLFGIEVNKDASPTCLPKIVPAEIVEKKPKLVDVVNEDSFETVRR